MHAKLLVAGDYMIVGSTNWTTSSKANSEVSVLLHLTRQGKDIVEGHVRKYKQQTVVYDNAWDEYVGERRDQRRSRSSHTTRNFDL